MMWLIIIYHQIISTNSSSTWHSSECNWFLHYSRHSRLSDWAKKAAAAKKGLQTPRLFASITTISGFVIRSSENETVCSLSSSSLFTMYAFYMYASHVEAMSQHHVCIIVLLLISARNTKQDFNISVSWRKIFVIKNHWRTKTSLYFLPLDSSNAKLLIRWKGERERVEEKEGARTFAFNPTTS